MESVHRRPGRAAWATAVAFAKFDVRGLGAVFLLLVSAGPLAAAAQPPTPAPTLRLALKPQMHAGVAQAMQVELRIDTAGAALPPLAIPRTLGPLRGMDGRVVDLVARDDAGEIPLHPGDGGQLEGLGGIPLAWTPTRPSRGVVTIRYRALVSHDTIPGPTWELRSQKRGISGAGWTFLVLPEDARAYAVTLRWDLSGYPEGASVLDSLPAAVDGGRMMSMAALRSTYFMAGMLQRADHDPGQQGTYRSASTAETRRFTQAELLDWSELAYRNLSELFGEPQLPPFAVMFRNNTLTNVSGTALPGALMATMAADAGYGEVKSLLAHEMTHVFMHGLTPESWFQEGLAVFYENRGPFLRGLFDADTYLDNANKTLRTYYSNVRRDMPMAEAQAAFWTDARARLQPYYRGAVYFMLTDGRLRRATGGKYVLDDALREFLQRRRDGLPVAAPDWVDLLSRHIGARARADYEGMLRGTLLVPGADALGPCFTRHEMRMPVFELGFAIASLMQEPRVIRGLDPDSPAARAGLREGDKVLHAVGLDELQSRPGTPMSLRVARDGGEAVVRFIPVGPVATGYQWARIDGAGGDGKCRH